MHIGLIVYGSLESLSGGYLYDRKLIDYQQRQGVQIEVISLPWRNYAFHLGHNLSRNLLNTLKHLQVDLLLQDELNHPSLFWLNYRARKDRSYPVISIVHHLRCSEKRPAWQNQFYRWIERSYLNSVDGFIFNSNTTRRTVEGLVRHKRPAVVAYPAGDRLDPMIQESQIHQRVHHPGPLRLIFVGNVIPRKGIHNLIAALKHLPNARFHLAIAGGLGIDKAYVDAVRDQVSNNNLADFVEFLGYLNKHELADQMVNSHVLVMPSSYEGFGIAYLEGMGFGLPALATKAGGASEIVSHGINGFLVDPEDIDGIIHYLDILDSDRKRLYEMSLEALQHYDRHPTWEQTGKQINIFLKTLAGHT